MQDETTPDEIQEETPEETEETDVVEEVTEEPEEEQVEVDIEPEVRRTTTVVEDPDDFGDPIERKLDTQGSEVSQLANKVEVSEFLVDKPEYRKYKNSILRHMEHEAYSNIPVHNIASMVSAKDMQKLGAEKERMTAKTVADTKSSGSTTRTPEKGETDWSSMSKEEFEKHKSEVMYRRT